jgi:hypothetical protein
VEGWRVVAVLDRLQQLLESFQKAAHGAPTWPPKQVKAHWDKVEEYQRYFGNDYAKMLQYAPFFNKTDEGKSLFTPVGLASEVCNFSADLLFSAEPSVAFDKDEKLLEVIQDANRLASRLPNIAGNVAAEGRGGIRIIRDDEVQDGTPLITHVHENNIIWDERHGDFVLGGTVVSTRTPGGAGAQDVYRVLETHQAGGIARQMFKGKSFQIGVKVPLDTLDEFKDLDEEEETGLDQPTLIRWDNVSGGRSDIHGQEVLLDAINEEFSLGREKSRKSKPITFAARELADEAGAVDLTGIILTGAGNLARDLGEDPIKSVETVQPTFSSTEVISWLNFLIDCALMFMAYSKASYGRDDGGSADSGKALKLRQQRTLLKKAGKDRMASETLTMAYAVAMCWQDGGSKVNDYRPDVQLGDGLPTDELEDAQTAAAWNTAGAISLEEKIRMRRPDWDDEKIQEEIQRIKDDREAATPSQLRGLGSGPDPNTNGAGEVTTPLT